VGQRWAEEEQDSMYEMERGKGDGIIKGLHRDEAVGQSCLKETEIV